MTSSLPPDRQTDDLLRIELTALGDTVNIAARLASTAQGGEVLVTDETATAAGLDPSLERRRLELKGKQELTQVVSLRVQGPPA